MSHQCHTCPAPASWRDQQGRCWCSSHLPTNGQYRSLPRPAEPDILERLEFVIAESELLTVGRIGGGGGLYRVQCDIVELAAAEIRRLRAELAEHASGDGTHKRHGRED